MARDVDWLATEGHKCRMINQMADVILRKLWGEIVHVESGKRIALQRKGGVYVVKMWIKNNDDRAASDFPRQGQ